MTAPEPARHWDALVLMGPPGSGKSHLGRALAAVEVARFEELEPQLIARFGTGEAFARRKAEALAFIRERYAALLAEPGLPLAIESTGLSDRPILEELAGRWRVAFAAMRTPRDVCVSRVAGREPGRNLENRPEAVERFHGFWSAEVAAAYAFDFQVRGVDTAEDVELVRSFLGGPGTGNDREPFMEPRTK